jgi:hypothetical protein
MNQIIKPIKLSCKRSNYHVINDLIEIINWINHIKTELLYAFIYTENIFILNYFM